jgi:hypothetical protein
MACGHRFASSLLAVSECGGRSRRSAAQPDSLLLQPALKLTTARHVKALQQIAPIQPERTDGVIRLDRGFELRRVARERPDVDPYLPIAPARHRLLAECGSQVTERLVERPAGMLFVLLGPEEREKGVAPLKAAGTRNGQVGEEGDALRLREDRTEVLALVVPQDERSENAELDHEEKESLEVAVTGRITQRSVPDHWTRSR